MLTLYFADLLNLLHGSNSFLMETLDFSHSDIWRGNFTLHKQNFNVLNPY